jgi:hypothetical protein
MPTTRADFEIHVKATADTAPLKDTGKALATVAENIKDAGSAAGKTQHSTDHLTLSHHQLHQAIHAVGKEFGGIGELGMLAYGGPLAAIGVLLELTNLLKKHFEEVAEAAAKVAAETRAISESSVKAMSDSAAAHRAAIAAIAEDEAKLNTAYAEGNTAMENRLTLFNEEVEGVLKVQEAREKAWEADLDQRVAAGQMDKDKAAQLKADARFQFDVLKDKGDERKMREHLVELENQQLQARAGLGGKDQSALTAAQAAEDTAAGRAAKAKTNAEQVAKSGVEISYGEKWLTGESISEHFASRAALAAELDATRSSLQNLKERGLRPDITSPEQDPRFAALQRGLTAFDGRVQSAGRLENQEQAKLKHQTAITAAAETQLKHDSEVTRTVEDRIDLLKEELELRRKINAETRAMHAQPRQSPDSFGNRSLDDLLRRFDTDRQ